MIRYIKLFLALQVSIILGGCQSIDNERIPNMAVNVSLAEPGIWNSYGVSGFGSHRNFIYRPGAPSQPTGFFYKTGSATGFGGVLLIEGMDPYNTLGVYPLAYDLACPVERNPDIRVYIDNENYVAVCPECNSTFDVTMAGGIAISGEAARVKPKYGLRAYEVIPSGSGGYFITNL